MTFTSTDLLVAKVIREGYKRKENRIKTIKGMMYKNNKSTSLYAHYEDNKRIIVGIHGADDVKLNILAIKKFIKIKDDDKIVKRVCRKLDSLLDSNKEIIIGGHSIGGYMINSCLENKDYPFKFISYGSYTPRIKRKWSMNKVRKHLYKTDWLSNKLLERENNVLVYDSNGINTHGLFNFLDMRQMNKNSV